MDKIKINETFAGIQGEGRNAGKPSVFIRVSGCNLNCVWCDSKFHKEGRFFSEKEFEKMIFKKSKKIKHIIFTGGEPALYFLFIQKFIQKVKKKRFTFEIETNGTIEFKNIFDQVNVSPKMKNAETKNLKIKAISKDFDYKFIIKNKEDLKEVFDFQKKYDIKNERIFLMPEGFLKTSQIENSKKVWKMCIENNFNFSPRLQVLLFNNKKKR